MDLDAARRALVADRAVTEERIAAMSADLDAAAAAVAGSNIDDEHDPEGSTVAFEREQFAAVRSQAQTHLAELDDALARLADGHYGRCAGCGAPIAPERLEALPATRLCITCASRKRS